jgi:hypothetical protein
MPPHIPQDVTDISSISELLRYAAAGQLQPLFDQGFTQEKIAQGAGLGTTARSAGPVLAHALGSGFSTRQLSGLDEIIGALAPELDRAGRLSSLALRLSAEWRTGNGENQASKIAETVVAAHIPPSWTRRTLTDPPKTEIEVLLRASGLISQFVAAGRMAQPGVVGNVRGRTSREVDLLGARLALMSVGPPTWRSYDAQTLLGMLASYTFDQTKDRLERKLRYSPLGFRVWRAITMLVILSENGPQAPGLRNWIRGLLRDSAELRKRSLHAGSSYDLELALTVPAEWSPTGNDWVGEALLTRARDPEATLRERGTAAMGLWQRAISDDRPNIGEVERDLRALVVQFRDPDTRPDAAAGLRWIAATLEHVMDNGLAVCNDWPEVDEPWYRHVHEAAAELDRTGIPANLVTGTKNLFLHMILQNAGLHRRHAIETVVTSGMNRAVARALVSLLGTEKDEAWLRIRVQAALGFMQRNDVEAQTDLTHACERAYANMSWDTADGKPPRSHITELHSSLFAVADCFATATGGERGRDARALLRPVLASLAETEGDQALILRRPARAAAYLLAVTAQPQVNNRKDLSQQLLEKLADHPDPVTRRLSSWILSFRFAEDGSIRTLLASADHGEPDDRPY